MRIAWNKQRLQECNMGMRSKKMGSGTSGSRRGGHCDCSSAKRNEGLALEMIFLKADTLSNPEGFSRSTIFAAPDDLTVVS